MKILGKGKYGLVTESLKKVTFNNYFARSVVEKHISGTVYADNDNSPSTFYIVHPYKMSLLFGDPENEEFNSAFYDYALNTARTRNYHEWMQVYPETWHSRISELFKGKLINSRENRNNSQGDLIEINTRVNFTFQPDKYSVFKQHNTGKGFSIRRTDKEIFGRMNGSVVPKYFWDNAGQFVDKSVGFSLFYQNDLAATAYAAFIHGKQLEIGIETVDKYRGQGFAQHACSVLIDYCLKNNYEPVWSCRMENNASMKLAQKLGFEPVKYIPYYRLCK
jgi:hypothetical protein